jgi:hypothetical protein
MKAELQSALKIFLTLVMWLAGLGAVTCLTGNVLSLFGVSMPIGVLVGKFAPLLFFVWIVAILVSIPMTRSAQQRDFWKAALGGCPFWMRRGLWILCGYGYLIGAVFLIKTQGHGGDAHPTFSMACLLGILMTFYAISFAVLYSALHSPFLLLQRKCALGHIVSPMDRFCPRCGSVLTPEHVA